MKVFFSKKYYICHVLQFEGYEIIDAHPSVLIIFESKSLQIALGRNHYFKFYLRIYIHTLFLY